MEIYEHANSLTLKLSNEDFLIIVPNECNDMENYTCAYDFELPKEEKRELYELIFNEKVKNELIKYEKYVPADIRENCMKCNYYTNCKYEKGMLKSYKETNKILKEYKDFIKTIKDGE